MGNYWHTFVVLCAYMRSHQDGSTTVIIVCLIFIAVVTVGYSVYLWSENRILQETSTNHNASNTMSSEGERTNDNQRIQSEQRDTSGTNIALSREVLTGQAVRTSPDEGISIECFILPDTLETVWVQYGNTFVPQEQTDAVSEGLSEGESGRYSAVLVSLPDEIEPNSLYSYQCFGADRQRDIVNGGIASFNSR